MLSGLSDEDLMLRYCAGELPAFRELYSRHSRALYRFIAWRSPRRDWVDEIVQDAWVGLHKARARYEPQASFRVYLYQIARNRLIDLLRQQQPLLASELVKEEEGGDPLDSLGATSDTSPETELETKQRAEDLHEAIRDLPSEQREALVLQQFNGLSLEEIAHLTAVPLETVKSRLRYAMQKLRQHYAAERSSREEQA